jgi:hypothetical protein
MSPIPPSQALAETCFICAILTQDPNSNCMHTWFEMIPRPVQYEERNANHMMLAATFEVHRDLVHGNLRSFVPTVVIE